MKNNNDGFGHQSSGQFVISYELLILLRWLVEHDADKFKKIIAKALHSGLQEDLHKLDLGENPILTEDMQLSIVDFFGLMEELLMESINENVAYKARIKKLMPAVDQIDSTVCDDATVRFSLEKATTKITHNPETNAKDVLFRELLKRWKPNNKKILN